MDDLQRAYAEDFGILFERLGGARMLGRVLGLLFVADPPEMTAEQLAAELRASRGSISQATRLLIQIGLIQRVSKPGVRVDFYRARRDAWVEASRHRQADLLELLRMFQRGLALMDGRSQESRAALEHSVEFLRFWNKAFEAMFDTWLEQSERSER